METETDERQASADRIAALVRTVRQVREFAVGMDASWTATRDVMVSAAVNLREIDLDLIERALRVMTAAEQYRYARKNQYQDYDVQYRARETMFRALEARS